MPTANINNIARNIAAFGKDPISTILVSSFIMCVLLVVIVFIDLFELSKEKKYNYNMNKSRSL